MMLLVRHVSETDKVMKGRALGSARAPRCGLSVLLAVMIPLLASLALTSTAHAFKEHRVRSGQTLSGIAKRYGVSVHAIRTANRLTDTSNIRAGQYLRIPENGVVYVRSGDTLGEIAKEHGVSAKTLVRLNKLKSAGSIRAGQRLRLPGYRAAARRGSGKSYEKTADNPGIVNLYRVGTGERMKLRLLNPSGSIRRSALKQLGRLMRSRRTGRYRSPDPRLVRMLAKVSDHFGGRQIRVVSGYRPPGGHTKHSSRHTKGDAIDFSIAGVPNSVLRDFCYGFSDVGVGYYPRSTFVHMDVRSKKAYWVDISRPGQRPRYVPDSRYPPRNYRRKRARIAAAKTKAEESSEPKMVKRKVIELDAITLPIFVDEQTGRLAQRLL